VALKEGGRLKFYAGGDEVTQGLGTKAGFKSLFERLIGPVQGISPLKD
jgi:hypothetical protein